MDEIKYSSLPEFIEMMKEPNKSICKKVLRENDELFKNSKGSDVKHQAWIGGYLEHINETMNIAKLIYFPLNKARKLPFSFSDVLLALFLHDIEKPWKQNNKLTELNKMNGTAKNKEVNKKTNDFRMKIIKKYEFKLTKDHENAIKYAEGEKEDYDIKKRVQTPLAAFVHMCDTWSARGWFDFPKNKESWE